MLDEKVRKKRIKLYAYNINYSNSQRLKENLMSFKNLNKDFYEDIIKNDLDLIKSKKNLEVIKDDAIKESIYATGGERYNVIINPDSVKKVIDINDLCTFLHCPPELVTETVMELLSNGIIHT